MIGHKINIKDRKLLIDFFRFVLAFEVVRV